MSESPQPPKRGDPGWEEYRSCTRKTRYESDLDPNIPGWLIAYRCRFCGCWHATSGKNMNATVRANRLNSQLKRRLRPDWTPD